MKTNREPSKFNESELLTEEKAIVYSESIIIWLFLNTTTHRLPYEVNNDDYFFDRDKVESIISIFPLDGRLPANLASSIKECTTYLYFRKVMTHLKKRIKLGYLPLVEIMGEHYALKKHIQETILDILAPNDLYEMVDTIKLVDLKKSLLSEDIDFKMYLNLIEAGKYLKVSTGDLVDFVNQGYLTAITYKGFTLYSKKELDGIIKRTLNMDLTI